MSKTLVLLIGLALAGAAEAQIKCWTTVDGKRGCGDVPPPGAKIRTVKGSTAPSNDAPAPGAAAMDGAAKDAKKGPMTNAEREQDFRKRQAEAQKSAAKAEQEKQDSEAKKDNCDRAREMLQALGSGQRMQRTDSKGERYFLDDAQREQETGKAIAMVRQSCG